MGGVIDCPERCESEGRGVIARTEDGGVTWNVAAITKRSVTHVTAVPGTRTVWATSSTCHYTFVACGKMLLKSRDAGLSWNPDRSELIGPSFASDTVGFAPTGHVIQGTSLIAVTPDGGHTWHEIQGPCHRPYDMTVSVSFPTATRGWALCAASDFRRGSPQYKAIYETRDGGLTWVSRLEQTRDGSPCCPVINGAAMGLSMFRDGNGFAWTGGANAFLYRTTDRGRTWSQVWRGTGHSELLGAWWFDMQSGIAVRYGGRRGWNLVRTTDGGFTWDSLGIYRRRPSLGAP
jgi:photosystem II stability/assembly factor-like uncharacterized protein